MADRVNKDYKHSPVGIIADLLSDCSFQGGRDASEQVAIRT